MGKKTAQTKAKEPIRMRFKEIANGNQSIYLDFYTGGKRQYEFLKLYLIPERTAADKEANRQTMATANAVKAQRFVELQNATHGFKLINLKQKARLTDYLQKLADEKKEVETIGQHRSYSALIRHIKLFRGEDTTFRQVTKEYCKDFMDYLDAVENANYKKGRSETYTSGLLSTNTKYSYVKLLNVALNRAIEEGILTTNPLTQLPKYERPKRQLLNREYLTIDEVKQLVKTQCIKPLVKNSFLFSCFSGLRYSDVKSLTWGQIQNDNEGQRVIKYIQKKTGKHEYLQLSGEACKFLPERRNDARDSDVIFPLVNNGYTNETLKSWILAAGITKRVTFHVGRHTNATLLLSLGVPIETVSKLLGHADIQTTQIYAKVIDKNKRDAVSKLDGLTD